MVPSQTDADTFFPIMVLMDSCALFQGNRQRRISTRKPIRPIHADDNIVVKYWTDLLMEKVQSSRNADNGTIFKQVGPLRVLWSAIIVICLLMVFFPKGDETGWHVIPVHVAPVVVILNLWGLLFDLLMSWLFMMQNHGQERLRYRHILLWDGFLLLALFVFWGPFFVSLLAGS
jgi:fumarate reductase subunit C